MISPQTFKEIVSGQRRGTVAFVVRSLFALLELPYSFVVQQRNRRYDRDPKSIERVDVPVICVGNLTMGGTGKTPMVHFVARWFRKQNIRVAIVSRGYGSVGGKQNDEAKELQAKLPDVPHLQNPDRVSAAKLAVDELEMQVIVLDDGFQHRRLARDIDLVLVDALEPFGFEHVFPRGTLREPLSEIKRASIVALSRADLVTKERRTEIQARFSELAPQAKWIEVAHVPKRLQSNTISTDITELSGKRVLAFCGLGNPAGFRRTLATCDANVLDFREFPDHHEYGREDIESLVAWIEQHQPDFVVCTHKDFVKIEIDQLGGVPLRALIVELEVLQGASKLEDVLRQITEKLTNENDSI